MNITFSSFWTLLAIGALCVAVAAGVTLWRRRIPGLAPRPSMRAALYLCRYAAALEYYGLRRREITSHVEALRVLPVYGELVNVNAYHQPGVEAGKQLFVEQEVLPQRLARGEVMPLNYIADRGKINHAPPPALRPFRPPSRLPQPSRRDRPRPGPQCRMRCRDRGTCG